MQLSSHERYDDSFENAFPPQCIWMGGNREAALEQLMVALEKESGIITLSGCSGIGKSTLVRRLLSLLPVQFYIITIQPDAETKMECYNRMACQLGSHRKFKSKGSFLLWFRRYTQSLGDGKRKLLVVVEDFDQASKVFLEEISFLAQLASDGRRWMTLLLVGEMPGNMSVQTTGIHTEPAAACRLEPLNLREAEDFISHVLTEAGTRANIFDPAAVQRIWRLSGGVPQRIDKICIRALRLGCLHRHSLADSDPKVKRVENLLPRLADEVAVRPNAAAAAKSLAKPRKTARLSFLAALFCLAAAATAGLIYFGDRLPSPAEIVDSETFRQMVFGIDGGVTLGAEVGSGQAPENLPRPPLSDLQSERDPVAQPAAGRSFVIHFIDEGGGISQEVLVELNRITAMISDFSNTEILIAAMIDSSGNYWQNRKLSNLRANTIKSFFIGKGVLPSNIEIVLSEMEEVAFVEPAVRAEMTGGRVKITFRANSIS
jgi:type II secretory pathway predicted ATPase ExeA/outer membrane protein OmpA-like peptidoglycan-associated protein